MQSKLGRTLSRISAPLEKLAPAATDKKRSDNNGTNVEYFGHANPSFQYFRDLPQISQGHGLEALQNITEVKIHAVERIRRGSYHDQNHVYHLLNSRRKRLFFVEEDSEPLSVLCCRHNRSFHLPLKGFVDGEETPIPIPVLTIDRNFTVSLCFFGTGVFGSKAVIGMNCPVASTNNGTSLGQGQGQVDADTGKIVGVVTQCWSMTSPEYIIFDGDGTEMFSVVGPATSARVGCCDYCVQVKNSFHVFVIKKEKEEEAKEGREREQVGKIFMDAKDDEQEIGEEDIKSLGGQVIHHTINVRLKKNLDPYVKSLILATAFLIDYNHYGPGCCEPLPGYGLVIIFLIVMGLIAIILTIVVKVF